MLSICNQLIHDEAGFIVSAELILVATIGVLSLVVGLTEVSSAVNSELNDVASAFGSINQSFCYNGQAGCKGQSTGSSYHDCVDACDQNDIVCNSSPRPEGCN
jgi:hypothetical protein